MSVSLAMSTGRSEAARSQAEINICILHDYLILDVPEPANVKMIVSELALMVSDSRRDVIFLKSTV